MDGKTDGRTENRTPISNLAKAGATKTFQSAILSHMAARDVYPSESAHSERLSIPRAEI